MVRGETLTNTTNASGPHLRRMGVRLSNTYLNCKYFFLFCQLFGRGFCGISCGLPDITMGSLGGIELIVRFSEATASCSRSFFILGLI